MKKSLVARGFIGAVASLLGVAAVGCGADGVDGAAGDSAEIGSTSQALDGTAPSVAAGAANMPNGSVREFAASCALTINGSNVMLVAGGVTAGGTYLRDAYLYDPGAGTWTATDSFGTLGTDERAFAKMIKLPGQNKCILIGGDKGGASFASTFIYNPAAASPNKWTAGPTLQEARSKFAVHECAGSTVLIAGGVSNTTRRSSAEVLNSGVTAWTKTNAVLTTAAQDIAMDADYGSLDKFFIAGGFTGTGENDQVTLLKTDSSCANLAATKFDTNSANGLGLVKTVAGVDVAKNLAGHVVLATKPNTFVVTAGREGTTAYTTARTYTVNWAAPTISNYGSDVANFLSGGAYYPVVVQVPDIADAAHRDAFLIIGGTDASNNGNGVRTGMGLTTGKVYEVQDGFRDSYTSGNPALSANLTDTRVGHVAEYLASDSKASVAAGVKVTLPGGVLTNADLLSVEAITP